MLRPKFIITGLAMAVVSAFALVSSPALAASNCPGFDDDDNAIVRCGFPDKAGFKADVNANKTNDLVQIYKHVGFDTSTQMDDLMNRGVWGWTHSNGQVILDDGRVVGTEAWSFGRQSFGNPNRIPFQIAGLPNQTFYSSPVGIGFADHTEKIRTLVLMDKEDKYMLFAVMNACGNPVDVQKPKFNCKELHKEDVDEDTFKFWTEVELKNATVKNLKYEVVDENDQVIKTIVKTNPAEKITLDFEPGSYTVRVTVTYIVNGKEQTEKLQTRCQKPVEVKEKKIPEFACTSIQTIVINSDQRKYKFVGTAEYKDIKVVSATFDFGDGSTANGDLKEINANKTEITSPEHQYAEFTGKKFIQLSVVFEDGKKDLANPKCKTEIAREVLSECVPPKGESSCELPKTGPTEIFAAAAGASGLGAAGVYYRASRRNLSSLLDKFRR